MPSSGREFDSPPPLSVFVVSVSVDIVPILLDGPGSQYLNLETRVRIPLGTPGRFADLWFTSGDHASVIEPANVVSAPRPHGRRPAPVLVDRDSSLRSLKPRFESWQGHRREGRSHPRLMISALPVHGSCNPRRLEASGGSHKAVLGGSIPPVATPLSVAQSGRAPVPGTGDWRFESSHSDHSRSTFPSLHAGLVLWREHRHDEPDQVSSILTPCTLSMWRNWQTQRF